MSTAIGGRKSDRFSISKIVESILDETEDRHAAYELAIKRVREWLAAHPDRAIDALMPIVGSRVWEAVKQMTPATKSMTRPNSSANRASTRNALAALGKNFVYSYMLPNGVHLGDATDVILEGARRVFATNLKENARNMFWIDAILKELPKGQKVREAFDQERLHKLLRSAEDDSVNAILAGLKHLGKDRLDG